MSRKDRITRDIRQGIAHLHHVADTLRQQAHAEFRMYDAVADELSRIAYSLNAELIREKYGRE